MTSTMQTLVVLLLVLLAGVYLGRRIWRQLATSRAKAAGGPGCAGCGGSAGGGEWDG